VLLEVTCPRIPCVTLAARMGDPRFVVRFSKAERFGLYCRVLVTGAVQAGDMVTVERFEGDTISALEMFRLFYTQAYDLAVLSRALNAPLHHVTRREYEVLLADLKANPNQ
jgi:MOSC domain-containing protein YiiM